MGVIENYKKIREKIPDYITLVIAAKTRTQEEIKEAIEAGATDIGENYVKEAKNMCDSLGEEAKKVRWHMIGHLQTNKINKALEIFDVIQTIDSLEKAKAVDERAKRLNKIIPCYIEINIGNEENKSGAKVEDVEELAKNILSLENLRLEGLMTMGPNVNEEELRLYFRKMREIFDKIKNLSVNIKILSMGMSDSYKIAIEEGSNMIRLGTIIFGERK